jgi:hypothetical protein
MLDRFRNRWYAFFYRTISSILKIVFTIEAGFLSRSHRQKLAHYSADIISWGVVIIIIIYLGELLELPITYYNIFSYLFIRNLIIMATISILLYISMSELFVRLIPDFIVAKSFLRPILIILSLIIGHDFIFTPKLLG